MKHFNWMMSKYMKS